MKRIFYDDDSKRPRTFFEEPRAHVTPKLTLPKRITASFEDFEKLCWRGFDPEKKQYQ